MASDARQWASRLDQESMKIHSHVQQLYAAGRQSNRAEGIKALASLDSAQHLVRDASQMMQQVSVGVRSWIAVTVADSGGIGEIDAGKSFRDINNENVPYINDIAKWLPEINSNFNGDQFSPFSNNCGLCAAAVFKRFEGDITAVASIGTLNIGEMNIITGRTQTSMSPGQISDYLISQGAGAHAVVGIDRKDSYGHWFNAFYDGQNVYTIDGQTGTISDWPPDYGVVTNWDVSV